ncbi:hypothetical protein Q4574_12930 [Aliiglaciecola sp. 3_MG-2023]|uniref:hypothetical protein n=1 Tax=Aliiglaciecola sp. 3_MG-2023 TaxID=3062644 RepID=UPI0026E2A577|nr:hypothetical protein [Aliiglaciecola sp. 3_MG-2023]MDO6694190.1 hypothetical protein [Aliiglaciecola sp. 3_MG-2023]
MKAMNSIFIAAVTSVWCGISMAVPISADSGVSFYHDIIIAGGGQLPIGLEVRSGGPDFSNPINTELQADDAVEFDDLEIVIAGLAPEAPSTVTRYSSSTRNADTEGAFGMNDTQLYQIVEEELVPDGNNDISERGVWGSGQAQASISSELFDTQADSDVSLEREFTLSNENATALTFSIEGTFEMGFFAMADGENSFAEAFAMLDLFFTSSNGLDIVFADTSLYINNQTETGDNAITSLIRETDVANTGHLSFTGNASATGSDIGGSQQAFGDGTFSYALGVTLQPGEEINMSHLITYSNLAAIEQHITEVSEPSAFLFILFSSGFFLFIRKRPR